MSSEEELSVKIADLGNQIKDAKQAHKPKEEWDPILQEMLQAKASYKALTGKDFGVQESSKAEAVVAPENQEASDKNKEKRALKAAAKAQREAEKETKRAERAAREQEKADRLAGVGQDNFGDAPLVQSRAITGHKKQWTPIGTLHAAMAGQEVLVRGHLQTTRSIGKGAFVLVRSTLYSVQGVAFESATISNAMIKYMDGLPAESVVDMQGTVRLPAQPVESATQKSVEIHITSFHCVCKTKAALPFQMEDACRPDDVKEAQVGDYNEDDEIMHDDGLVHVGQKVRLDYRWLDLRTPANQSIFRIESMIGVLFRDCLVSKGFVEIHTPKLIGGASEGGSEVFTLDYFGQPACLAMSPQLHKQMTAACSGFERVFETGPVFRAENSNTRRHLCEFTGFDMEMVIHEHYNEVLDVLSDLFIYIFDGVNERCKDELERVREQHPFEDLKYLRPTLKLSFAEGCTMLREAGIDQKDYDDLSTENEKKLGDLVKVKYDTDFFFMDKYPLSVRPFYTMPDPVNPKLSNSYDFFIRGQEILSGAQRIHEPDLLVERATAHGIPLADIDSYVNSFRNGAMPHGGGGIGLERVVMLFLGLPNIRKSAWFPRDPKRIAP
jgi:nondiscriminating aspartyl-tRNA synthetase